MFPAAPFPQLLVSPAHSGGEDTAAEDEAELADTTEAAAARVFTLRTRAACTRSRCENFDLASLLYS